MVLSGKTGAPNLPKSTRRHTFHASCQAAGVENDLRDLGVTGKGFSNAGEFEDQEGSCHLPVAEKGSTPRMLEPASDELNHTGPLKRRVPLTEDGLGKAVSWLRDILRGDANDVPGCGDPIEVVIDKVVAEPSGEAGERHAQVPRSDAQGQKKQGERRTT